MTLSDAPHWLLIVDDGGHGAAAPVAGDHPWMPDLAGSSGGAVPDRGKGVDEPFQALRLRHVRNRAGGEVRSFPCSRRSSPYTR